MRKFVFILLFILLLYWILGGFKLLVLLTSLLLIYFIFFFVSKKQYKICVVTAQTGGGKTLYCNSIVQKYIIDFTPILMIICICLFMIDIIVRKLKWQDIKTLFGLSKKKNYQNVKGVK